MQKQADEMRFVCRTRVALLCRVLRSVSLLFFSLKSLFSFFFRSKNKKGHKKTHIKLFWGLLTKTFTKISKAPSFSSLGEDGGHARSSSLVCLVWYVRTSVVFLLLFLCSNAFTKRRRRRGVSSRARSARARRRVDEKGVERG